MDADFAPQVPMYKHSCPPPGPHNTLIPYPSPSLLTQLIPSPLPAQLCSPRMQHPRASYPRGIPRTEQRHQRQKGLDTELPTNPEPTLCLQPGLTVDREVHPAAVVEGVVLLVQHQHLALVPALVLGAHLLNAQGCLVVQAGPACGGERAKPINPKTPRPTPAALTPQTHPCRGYLNPLQTPKSSSPRQQHIAMALPQRAIPSPQRCHQPHGEGDTCWCAATWALHLQQSPATSSWPPPRGDVPRGVRSRAPLP